MSRMLKLEGMTSFVTFQVVYIQKDLHLEEVVFHHCKKFLLLRGVFVVCWISEFESISGLFGC